MPHNPVSGDDNAAAPAVAGADPAPLGGSGASSSVTNYATGSIGASADHSDMPPDIGEAPEGALRTAALDRMDLHVPFDEDRPALWVPLAVTTNLSINFLKRPGARDLIAEARLFKLGKRLAVGEVELRSDSDNDLVAHVTSTYSIPDERPSE